MTEIVPVGRNWQARRTPGEAPIRSRVCCSSSSAGGQKFCPAVTWTLQVEQRALPPQIEACATWKLRLASNTVQPLGTQTSYCQMLVTEGIRRRLELVI